MTECVKVIVRCRPLNQKQIQKGKPQTNKACKSIVDLDKSKNQVALKKMSNSNTTIKYFSYDHVFDAETSQREVYEQSSFFIVENVLNGYNGTIFAYGQTGCGKTHTMFGVENILSAKKSSSNFNKQNPHLISKNISLEDQAIGIIPRAFRQIVTVINSQSSKSHLINCTFIEIYNQQIHDLLGKDPKTKITLQQTPDGLVMKELSLHLVKNISEMEKLIEVGYKNRKTRQTAMNKQSSRSHCIFTIKIQESESNEKGIQKFKIGKLNLVDLAGSQRQSKTNLTNEGFKEAAKINLSLSALGNVISALVDGKKEHIPYRDSKLTRILNDSLGGNTKTVMIATISPADLNYQQTLSTLRYSNRAKFIVNKPIINQDPKDALLRKYEEEIRNLKMILQGKLPYIKGNESFYINTHQKQLNIFQRFPQLKNQQNQAIMNQMNEIEQLEPLTNSKKQIAFDQEQYNSNQQQVQSEIYSKSQKKQLRKQLNFLQKITKKQTQIGPELLEQLKKINELKQKLKQQALKEQIYKQQQKKHEMEMLNIQKSYKNLNDEVDSIKNKFNQLKVKYLQTTQQLKDTRQAHEKQKEEILQALRIQQAENNKIMEILNVIVDSQQLQKLFRKCQWIDKKKQWVVPKFEFSAQQGIVMKNDPLFKQFLLTEKKMTKQLSNLQKASKTVKQTNLMIERKLDKNLSKKIVQSQKKTTFFQGNTKINQKNKLQRSQTQRQNLKEINLFESEYKKKKFKYSYYSDSNQQKKTSVREISITNKSAQKKRTQKHKISLEPLTKVRSENQQHPGLDLQKIKQQILSEIKEKNKMISLNRQNS